jgi:hypothetical protein
MKVPSMTQGMGNAAVARAGSGKAEEGMRRFWPHGCMSAITCRVMEKQLPAGIRCRQGVACGRYAGNADFGSIT